MPTTKDTWDTEHVDSLVSLLDEDDLMYYLFWGTLEHDSYTAEKLAKQAAKFEPELREKLIVFKKSYLDLRKTLLKATRKSEKF